MTTLAKVGKLAIHSEEQPLTAIRDFRIDIPEAELDDLRQRLTNTRFPEAETPDDWSQGVPLAYARELRDYWLEEYDWRSREARYNEFAQYETSLSELPIHFLHVRSPEPAALPQGVVSESGVAPNDLPIGSLDVAGDVIDKARHKSTEWAFAGHRVPRELRR